LTKIQYQAGRARSRGRPKIGPKAKGTAAAARLYAQGFSIREVGAVLKMSTSAVQRRLKAGGAAIRTKARQSSKLKRLDQAQLFGYIADFGVGAAAAKYGVEKRTLQYYLAGLRREVEGDK